VLLEDVRLRAGLQPVDRVGLIHVRLGIFVRDHFDRGRELHVAAHVIEVHMCVDDRRHRFIGECFDLLEEGLAPSRQLRVHHDDAGRGDEGGRIPAAALQDVEIVLQLIDFDHHRRRRTAAPGRLLEGCQAERQRADDKQHTKDDCSSHKSS